MLDVIINKTGNFIWSYYFLPLLLLVAIILTIACNGMQFRNFTYAMKHTIGKAFIKSNKKQNGVSPFQASSTALGSTIGTGNIVGTAQAICMGGPGALFWLWVAALISMIVKYAEIALAIYYRKQTPGYGPMDYIEHGIKSRKMASIYAFLALLSSFAMGNLVQASSITDAFLNAINSLSAGPALHDNTTRIAVGFALSALSIIILYGGANRIIKTAESLVPFMLILFILVSLTVIALNIYKLPQLIYIVLREAFEPGCICAGISGVSTAQCIQWGIRRSAFSNEAGLGTAAIAHASAETDSPFHQGLWGIFEVFADTILICSCTSLCILCSGIDIPWGELKGSDLFLNAISTVFGSKLSSLLLSLFIGLFAYTSIIGWAFYGGKCSSYIWGDKYNGIYQAVFCILLILGSVMPVEYIWKIADFINALMSVPNLAALLVLTPVVYHINKDSFS